MLINLNEFPKSITNVYYLSNSPSYLYNMLRDNNYIKTLSLQSTNDLIETFKAKMNEPIGTIHEMAGMYALIIALTFKPIGEVQSFFNEVKQIKFEWFADVVNLFEQNYMTTPIIQSVNVPKQNLTKSSIIVSGGSLSFSK